MARSVVVISAVIVASLARVAIRRAGDGFAAELCWWRMERRCATKGKAQCGRASADLAFEAQAYI